MLTETIDLDGIRLGLVDTAGIRTSGDEVELEGVSRARRAAEIADLVIFMLDRSRPLEDIDRALLHETAGAARIVVMNKVDLPAAWSAAALGLVASRADKQKQEARSKKQEGGWVGLSLKTGAGFDEVRAAMLAALDVGEPLRDAPIISNVRHEALIRDARESIARALANLDEAGESAREDLVLADLGDARRAFEEVTGRRTSEDLLRRIFERFCIGK
jgi:tRNA modification GTPase